MTSEWLRVMLDEIARKQAEAEQDRLEFARRRAELDAAAPPQTAAPQQEHATEGPVDGGPARGRAGGLPPA